MSKWCLDHPWMTFWLVLIIGCSSINVISRFMRMIMVSLRGWPTNPKHDADGDFKDPEEKDV